MKLVVDANIIFAALIAPAGQTASLILLSGHELLSPAYVIEEINKYKSEIIRKSGLSPEEIDIIFNLLFSKIRICHAITIPEKVLCACPDSDDALYVALALEEQCALWSNDKALKQQNLVVVYTTTELLKN